MFISLVRCFSNYGLSFFARSILKSLFYGVLHESAHSFSSAGFSLGERAYLLNVAHPITGQSVHAQIGLLNGRRIAPQMKGEKNIEWHI